MHEILHDYETLIRLLQSQEQALNTDHSQKCTALQPLITLYRLRLEAHQERLRSVSSQERELLDPLVETLTRQISTCQKGWELRRQRLEEARNQLRAAQHLARNNRPAKRNIRLNWNA